MAPIDFYHFPASAPCRKVLLTVRNLGIDVNIKFLDIWAKEQFTEEYLKMNPEHCVPTINDNGFVLWESRAICAYLIDSTSPNHSLYPVDPKIRAQINRFIAFDAQILNARMRDIFSKAFYTGETKISNENRNNLINAYELLNEYLNGKKWFVGDSVTLADLIILATLASTINCGASIDKYNNIAAWYERCKSLPGFTENDEGGKVYAKRVKGILTDKF